MNIGFYCHGSNRYIINIILSNEMNHVISRQCIYISTTLMCQKDRLTRSDSRLHAKIRGWAKATVQVDTVMSIKLGHK